MGWVGGCSAAVGGFWKGGQRGGVPGQVWDGGGGRRSLLKAMWGGLLGGWSFRVRGGLAGGGGVRNMS